MHNDLGFWKQEVSEDGLSELVSETLTSREESMGVSLQNMMSQKAELDMSTLFKVVRAELKNP